MNSRHFFLLLLRGGDVELEVDDIPVLDHVRLALLPYRAASSSAGNARMMSTGTSSFVRSCSEYRPSLPVPAPNTKMYTGSWSGTSSKSCRLDQHTPRATGPPTELFDALCSSRENG